MRKLFWSMIVVFISCGLTTFLFHESGIQPVSESQGVRYAVMGYLFLLFAGALFGLLKLTVIHFCHMTVTLILLGIALSLASNIFMAIGVLGAWYQALIGLAVLAGGFVAGVKFSNFYIDSIAVLQFFNGVKPPKK